MVQQGESPNGAPPRQPTPRASDTVALSRTKDRRVTRGPAVLAMGALTVLACAALLGAGLLDVDGAASKLGAATDRRTGDVAPLAPPPPPPAAVAAADPQSDTATEPVRSRGTVASDEAPASRPDTAQGLRRTVEEQARRAAEEAYEAAQRRSPDGYPVPGPARDLFGR